MQGTTDNRGRMVLNRNDDGWLTTEQVADLLVLPIQTLYFWRATGADCPPAHRVGKHLRWRRSDVEQWLSKRPSR